MVSSDSSSNRKGPLFDATGLPAAAILFIGIFYVAQVWYAVRFWWPPWEKFGFEASYQVRMLLAFLGSWGLARWLIWLDNQSGESERNRVLQMLAHAEASVGIWKTNVVMLVASILVLLYVSVLGVAALIPAPVATTLAAVSLLIAGRKAPWPVPRANFTLPDKIPILEPTVGERRKRVRLAWSFDVSDGRSVKGEIADLVVDEADWYFAAATNPTVLGTGHAEVIRLVDDMVNRLPNREVDAIRDSLTQMAQSRTLDVYNQLCNALALVQSIAYVSDAQSKGKEEYWRYPVETLWDGCGDCEDKAILLCAIYRALFRAAVDPSMRLRAFLLLSTIEGHAAVAVGGPNLALPVGNYFVIDGVKYYFCETTAEGRVGEVPAGIDPATYVPIPIT